MRRECIEHQALFALIQKHKRIGSQVGERHLFLCRQRMRGRQQCHQLVVIDHALLEPSGKSACRKAKINHAIVHPLGVARVIALLEGKAYARVQGSKIADHARQHGSTHVGKRRDANISRRKPQQLLPLALELELGGHNLAQVRQILFTVARKRHTPLTALDKRGTQLTLERPDGLAHRTLRIAQLVGRTFQAAAIDHHTNNLIPRCHRASTSMQP